MRTSRARLATVLDLDSRTLVLLLGLLTLPIAGPIACNTVEGAGEDIEAAGESIDSAAD